MSYLPYATARRHQWATPLTLSLALHGAAVIVFLTVPFVTFNPPSIPSAKDMIIRLEILDLEGMLQTVPVTAPETGGIETNTVLGEDNGTDGGEGTAQNLPETVAVEPETPAEIPTATLPETAVETPAETPTETPPEIAQTQPEIAPEIVAMTAVPASPLDTAAILSPLAEVRAPALDPREAALALPPQLPETPPATVGIIAPPGETTPEAPPTVGNETPAIGSPLAAPDETSLLIGALLTRIRSVEAPACTVALPRRSSEGRVGLSLIGPDRDALSLYGAQLAEGLPTPVSSVLEVVDRRQCAALDALSQTAAYPASRIGFQLDSSTLTNGETLKARIIGAGGLALAVMMIDDNGVVQDLSRFTTIDGTDPVISAPVSRAGDGRETRQLLMVFGTTGAALDLTGFEGRMAQDVFNSLGPQRLNQAAFAVVSFDVR